MFKTLGVATNHTAHLGRILGPKKLEMLEFLTDEIRVLGNWEPKTQESTYSTKLPMKVLRAMAGFDESGGMHYNPRTDIEVPTELRMAVFPWLADSEAKVLDHEKETNDLKPTARQFFKMLTILSSVVVQDVAAIMIKHPERCEDCLLMQEPLFKRDDFVVSLLSLLLIGFSKQI